MLVYIWDGNSKNTIFIRFKLVRGNTLVLYERGFLHLYKLFIVFCNNSPIFVNQLIISVKSKETEFTQLIESNQGIIHKVCRIYCDTPETREDLFQEIVLQLWKSFDSFKGDSKFSTWMYRVGLNTAITLFRQKNRTISTTSLDDGSFFNIRSNDYDEEYEEKLKFLYACIKKLNDVERALILLYLEDLPYRDIANTIGISEVNARVKMNRAKTKLKEMMNPQK